MNRNIISKKEAARRLHVWAKAVEASEPSTEEGRIALRKLAANHREEAAALERAYRPKGPPWTREAALAWVRKTQAEAEPGDLDPVEVDEAFAVVFGREPDKHDGGTADRFSTLIRETWSK